MHVMGWHSHHLMAKIQSKDTLSRHQQKQEPSNHALISNLFPTASGKVSQSAYPCSSFYGSRVKTMKHAKDPFGANVRSNR